MGKRNNERIMFQNKVFDWEHVMWKQGGKTCLVSSKEKQKIWAKSLSLKQKRWMQSKVRKESQVWYSWPSTNLALACFLSPEISTISSAPRSLTNETPSGPQVVVTCPPHAKENDRDLHERRSCSWIEKVRKEGSTVWFLTIDTNLTAIIPKLRQLDWI